MISRGFVFLPDISMTTALFLYGNIIQSNDHLMIYVTDIRTSNTNTNCIGTCSEDLPKSLNSGGCQSVWIHIDINNLKVTIMNGAKNDKDYQLTIVHYDCHTFKESVGLLTNEVSEGQHFRTLVKLLHIKEKNGCHHKFLIFKTFLLKLLAMASIYCKVQRFYIFAKQTVFSYYLF